MENERTVKREDLITKSVNGETHQTSETLSHGMSGSHDRGTVVVPPKCTPSPSHLQ